MNNSKPETIYHITLLRHGESEGNVKKIWQGQTEFPLTNLGRQKAHVLAERWRVEGMTFDLVIASPLSRARDTAEIIADALQVPMEIDPVWLERDNGRYAGLEDKVIRERLQLPKYLHPHYPVGETGETFWELFLRGGMAINSLIRRPPGRYLVVSHGGILNTTLYAALGIAPQSNFQGPAFHFSNTSFASLTYTPRRNQWAMLGVNEGVDR